MSEDSFKFFMPATPLRKANASTEELANGDRIIQGIASTSTLDLQNEILDQKGIDTSYFMSKGYFNADHKPGPENKIGEPRECKVTKQGLWVKGILYKEHPVADHYWSLMTSMEKSNATRKMGFSVEGSVRRRRGNVIEACWIKDIALTPQPVNYTTWAEIVKSLSTSTWDMSSTSPEVSMTQALDNQVVDTGVPHSTSCEMDSVSNHQTMFTREQAIAYLMGKHSLSEADANTVVDAVFLSFIV